jgi:16S rRNA C967 or C1407 C5-methylase (RsmB/RsmF family)
VVEKVLEAGEGFELGNIVDELSRLRNDKILTFGSVERVTQGSYFRTYPGIHPCDGFFAAILRKR